MEVRRATRQGRRRGARLLAALLGLVIVIPLLAAGSASAHAQLVSTSPSSGQELTSSPKDVTIRFAEGVRPVTGGIKVLAEDGTRVDEAKPTSHSGVVTLALPTLPSGAYVVAWRVVSADGHPVRGAFTFRVGGTGDQAVAAKLAQKLLVSGTSKTDVSAAAAVLRTLSFAAMATLIGAAVHVFLVDRRTAGVGRGVTALVRWSTIVAAIAGIGSVLLYGPLVTGRSLGAVTDGPLLTDTLNDHVGQALVARTIALVLLGFVLAGIARRERAASFGSDRAPAIGLAALVIGAAVAQAFTGHGGTGRTLAVALPSTVVHVIAMGVWTGGLVCLLIVLRAARRGRTATDNSSASGVSSDAELVGITRRFSTLAGFSVGALTITGAFALWRQAGSLDALRETPSGKLLLVKLALVAVLVLAGAKNRRTLAPSVRPDQAVAGVRRVIGIEALLFAGVLAVTALVVNLAPARDVVARPVSVTVTTPTGLVDITIAPARRGPNELHIYALTKDGATRPIEGIEATLSNPAQGVEQLESRIVRAGPNHFQALALDLPLKGTWRIDVNVKLDAFTEESGSATFTLK